MTKIIFLDFDGVLNSELFYTSGRADLGKVRSNIDPKSVSFLNNLIKATDAKVVVSSTWRLGRTVEELQKILDAAGFKGEVIGTTPDMRKNSVFRGNEINFWMNENYKKFNFDKNNFRHYVIFDDDSDMLYWQSNNYIQIDAYCGLTPNNVYCAEKILNS
jgi:hypothetical protein